MTRRFSREPDLQIQYRFWVSSRQVPTEFHRRAAVFAVLCCENYSCAIELKSFQTQTVRCETYGDRRCAAHLPNGVGCDAPQQLKYLLRMWAFLVLEGVCNAAFGGTIKSGSCGIREESSPILDHMCRWFPPWKILSGIVASLDLLKPYCGFPRKDPAAPVALIASRRTN